MSPWSCSFIYLFACLAAARTTLLSHTIQATGPPIASLSISTPSGGWTTDAPPPLVIDFGPVLAGAIVGRQIRLCNTGQSTLTITRSRPPSLAQLAAVNPGAELYEGQTIAPGSCATGTVAVYSSPQQPNRPAQRIESYWILGTDGKDARDRTKEFGIRGIKVGVTITTRQVGPLNGQNGTGVYQYVGCFRDAPARNLEREVNGGSPSRLQNNTNGNCMDICAMGGYVFAGTEYRQECWCGNSIGNGAAAFRDEKLGLCGLACTGDGGEQCGGEGGYLSLYADQGRFDIVGFLDSVKGSTGSTTPTTTAGSATPTGSTGPAELWGYLGCYRDNVDSRRTLSSKTNSSDGMTLEACAAFCSGFNFFGTEYARECYCGYSLPSGFVADSADCNTPCSGNKVQICGSGDRLSVYRNSVYNTPPPTPSHVPRVSSGAGTSWVWTGCYTEVSGGRALKSASLARDDMTAQLCASFCGAEGTKMMGLEYGRECWCGDSLEKGSAIATQAECDMVCAGDGGEYCGGKNRLDVYRAG
ncbi:WSC domain-containing protein [Echria macrotheca]|uniref:WSC domain-containing protein n=1 Tax=Echria macrotheca TaxID=438768 RepID=A0AAJ0BIC6_9PEZI|nr:WSC domain-containing protein [Echria macrotheca]